MCSSECFASLLPAADISLQLWGSRKVSDLDSFVSSEKIFFTSVQSLNYDLTDNKAGRVTS